MYGQYLSHDEHSYQTGSVIIHDYSDDFSNEMTGIKTVSKHPMPPRKFMFWNLVILMLSLGTAFIVIMATANAANAGSLGQNIPTLKETSLVHNDVITLGDIFNNISDTPVSTQNKVLGHAPLPGNDLVLNARTLYHIAKTMNINWSPISATEKVTIRRAAYNIDTAEIETAIMEELSKNQGVYGDFRIEFIGETPRFTIPLMANTSLSSENKLPLRIDNFAFKPLEKTFTATLKAADQDKIVSGQVIHQMSVPILKQPMQNGDMISAGDLDWILIDEDKLAPQQLVKDVDIIGMTPRHVVQQGKPLLKTDLEAPKIIARGELVRLIYQHGSLELSARGKSLQEASKGDIIRVVNVDSNKNLQGVVTGDGEVSITLQ